MIIGILIAISIFFLFLLYTLCKAASYRSREEENWDFHDGVNHTGDK